MIIKASQRGGGANLAAHLTRTDENEHVEIAELRGFISDDLHGAFKEVDAIRRGTKCSQYLFSASFSPPQDADLKADAFMDAINRVEQATGLSGQPRAVVFHEKEGRRHAHAVWSRIDAETMTARHLPFFKNKLMEVARELYLEHGYAMPRGMTKASERDPTNFTLAEYQMARRRGEDPRNLKIAAQDSWAVSDDRKAFEQALQARGLFLAKGDKRALVILDHNGEVHALSRTLGLKTKDVRAKIGEPNDLQSVAEAKAQLAERMTPKLKEHIEQSRLAFKESEAKLAHFKMEMTNHHRKERSDLTARQSLEWINETKERQARMPRGFKAIWSFFSGKTGEIRRQNESEAKATTMRHASERHEVIARQLSERRVLDVQYKALRSRQAEQLMELRRDVGRYMAMRPLDTPSQKPALKPDAPPVRGLSLKLDQ